MLLLVGDRGLTFIVGRHLWAAIELFLYLDPRVGSQVDRMHDTRLFVAFNGFQLFRLESNDEHEIAAVAPPRLAGDFAAQLVADHAADVQALADSARVDLLGLLNEPIKLEKLVHVLLLDAGAVVMDLRISGTKGVINFDDFVSENPDGSADYTYRSGGWGGVLEETNIPSKKPGAVLMFEDMAAAAADPALREQWMTATMRTQSLLDAAWIAALESEK